MNLIRVSKKSTIVRAVRRAFFQARAGLLGLPALEPVRAAVALHRWFHPQRPAKLLDFTGVTAPSRAITFDVGGDRLEGRLFADAPGRPTALLLHGWESQAAHMGAFVDPLVNAGFRVAAFDLPAHGRSTGATVTVQSWAAAVTGLASRLGGVQAVVAHSFGGTAALLATTAGFDPGRLVIIASSVHADWLVRDVVRRTRLSPPAAARFRAEVESVEGTALADLDVSRRGTAVRVPLLVFHDPGDRDVPIAESRTLAAAVPGARLVVVTRVGHRRILKHPGVIAETVAFVRGAARHARHEPGALTPSLAGFDDPELWHRAA